MDYDKYKTSRPILYLMIFFMFINTCENEQRLKRIEKYLMPIKIEVQKDSTDFGIMKTLDKIDSVIWGF